MTIWTILASSAGVVALAAAGSLLLPRHVHVERQATLSAAPEAVLALAASNTGYQQFNPYLSADPALKIDPFGPATGVGSGFAFDGKDGTGTQVVAEVRADAVRYDIDLGPMGQPTQTIATRSVDGGVLVTWSMDADMGFNPVGRVMGLFLDRMIGNTFEQGLGNLATAL
ncbi:SRPBCC family protein [uncultured Tateyamaria sp.]|uniref:SRPBCC family protein n=1 Tax=uncultured Tateyamaria sp. TaxID=455651 RepID=UPI0026226832|nr:SRPBCC family protein [uncultured Tateyamaria sp.]